MFCSARSENKARGFTLIEALITLTVFTIGIIGAFSFALSNMNSVRDNFDRYLATNLAREGLEIVKNVRDSNWLRIDANEDCDLNAAGLQPCAWDQNLGYGFYIVDYTPVHYPPTKLVGISSGNVNYLDNSSPGPRLYINAGDSNFYSHTSGANTTATSMYRTIQLSSICLNTVSGAETVVTDNGCGGDLLIGVQAIAHLRWTRAGKTGQLEMTDNLYNWRK